jgi:hypothetical protein
MAMMACSPTAAAPSPSPDLKAEYQRMVDPANVATAHLADTIEATPLNGDAVRAAAKAVEDTDIAFDSALLTFEAKVPANVRPHVDAARAAISRSIADVQLVVESTTDAELLSALITWENELAADQSVFVLLHSDLGLPPSSPLTSSPSPAA